MKKKIWIVVSVCGSEMSEPEVLFSLADANTSVKEGLVSYVLDNFGEHLEEDVLKMPMVEMSADDIIAWAEKEGHIVENAYVYPSEPVLFSITEKDIESISVDIKFAKVIDGSEAKIPEKRYEDAGFDIYPCFDKSFIRIPKHATIAVPTGIASALPEDYYFQIEERGSTGIKGIKKSAGVIDSGYRGEWFIAITNTNDKDLYIARTDVVDELKSAARLLETDIIIYPYEKAIAQAVLHEVTPTNVGEINYDALKEIKSERGSGNCGSSGK